MGSMALIRIFNQGKIGEVQKNMSSDENAVFLCKCYVLRQDKHIKHPKVKSCTGNVEASTMVPLTAKSKGNVNHRSIDYFSPRHAIHLTPECPPRSSVRENLRSRRN